MSFLLVTKKDFEIGIKGLVSLAVTKNDYPVKIDDITSIGLLEINNSSLEMKYNTEKENAN